MKRNTLVLRANIISKHTEIDLSTNFTATKSYLDVAVERNDLRLCKYIVQKGLRKCADAKGKIQAENLGFKTIINKSDMLQVMENCCRLGRFRMVQHLLKSDLKFDEPSMSKFMDLAIGNHSWKIVNLLLENGASPWHDNDINICRMITEKNFKMVRKILVDGIPNHHTEKLVYCAAQ